jgi:hypothetical protein
LHQFHLLIAFVAGSAGGAGSGCPTRAQRALPDASQHLTKAAGEQADYANGEVDYARALAGSWR